MVYSKAWMAVAVTYFTASSAHMTMKQPFPYGAGSLNSSPLAADGSDFPCKQRDGVYGPAEGENNFAVGEQQSISFMGSAVHGGGSCQISLTTDKEPTKDSSWKVIHSIEGGCPLDHAENLPDNPTGSGADTFNFEIPASIKPGEYTLAWTWFNRIGNREMYMNCAPVTVTGAKKRRYAPKPQEADSRKLVPLSKRADLPEMFTANIGNGCSTVESKDLKFPEPGSSVEKAGSSEMAPPNCGAGGGAPAPGGAPDTTAPDTTAPDTTAPDTTAPDTTAPDTEVESDTTAPDTTAPDTTAPDTTVPDTTAPDTEVEADTTMETTEDPGQVLLEEDAPVAPADPATEAPADPATEAPADLPAGGSGGSGGSAQTGPCDTPGTFNCIGGSQYQQCASGQWSAPMAMAGGTACTGGMGPELTVAATKRSVHRRREH